MTELGAGVYFCVRLHVFPVMPHVRVPRDADRASIESPHLVLSRAVRTSRATGRMIVPSHRLPASPPLDRSPAIDPDARSGASCPTWALDDAPVDEDQLGSHKPIAAAIHELVAREDGGRTIGLEGPWGSGKSTVIRLLARRMCGDDELVVVFDAWAHEGDPLRRSFLEKLIDILIAEEWVDGKKWRERRAKLASRARVEQTRPRLTGAGIVASAATALFAILVPAGVAVLGAGLAAGDPAAGTAGDPAIWRWGVGILGALLLGVLVLAGLALCRRTDDAGGSWPALLSLRTETESDRETVETPDPTSVEFEREFGDLMGDALGDVRARTLVLVVDNLDRVEPEDARAVWATLQTFLHHTNDPRPRWLDSLWVLLPYDPGGIAGLWNGLEGTPGSFLDKSIQVRFEVPLPLLTDWRSYLDSLLCAALPEHDADRYLVYRLYQYRRARASRAPSPRELKLYVNRIGALHRRWQHELPLASLAYYASLGRPASEVASELSTGHLPKPDVKPLLDPDHEAHLAAIAFNAPPERALQLLYGPRIDNSLMREDADGLAGLAGRPGFWDALVGSGFVRAPSSSPPTLLLAASRLVEIPEELRPEDAWGAVTSMLARAGCEADGWAPLTPVLASRLSDLLSLVPRRDAEEIAAGATANAIEPRGGGEWGAGAHVLLSRVDWLAVRASGAQEEICDALSAFGGIAGWEDCAARLSIAPEDREAFDGTLAGRVATAPAEALAALAVLRRADPGMKWDPFVSVAGGRLRDYVPVRGRPPLRSAPESRSLLGILRAAPGGSHRERADLVSGGQALVCVGIASAQDDDVALGDWLYEVLRWSTREERAARTHRGHAARGWELAELLFDQPTSERVGPLERAIRRLPGFDLVSLIRSQPGGRELAAALAEALEDS